MSDVRGRGWAEVVGIFALVLGLVFLGYEINQSRDIAISDKAGVAGDVEVSVRTLIVENADIWNKGCLGEDLIDSERTAFQHLVFAVSFKAFTRWNASRTSVGSANPKAFIGYVGKSVYAFPGFARAFNAIEWGSDWKEAIDTEVLRLREVDPHPAVDVATCGLF